MALRFGVIRQKVTVKASPKEVYDAYLDPRKHSEFTGSPARISRRIGGSFMAWDGYISGKILELESGKKIVQEWTTTEWPAGYPPSILSLTFRPKGAGTELVMLHSKVPAEQTERYTEGWMESYWEPLKEHFANSLRPGGKQLKSSG